MIPTLQDHEEEDKNNLFRSELNVAFRKISIKKPTEPIFADGETEGRK